MARIAAGGNKACAIVGENAREARIAPCDGFGARLAAIAGPERQSSFVEPNKCLAIGGESDAPEIIAGYPEPLSKGREKPAIG